MQADRLVEFDITNVIPTTLDPGARSVAIDFRAEQRSDLRIVGLRFVYEGTGGSQCPQGEVGPQGPQGPAGPSQLSDNSTTCSSTLAGTLRFSSGRFEGCDGTAWVSFTQLPGEVVQVAHGFTERLKEEA